jgi:hypothetical protein
MDTKFPRTVFRVGASFVDRGSIYTHEMPRFWLSVLLGVILIAWALRSHSRDAREARETEALTVTRGADSGGPTAGLALRVVGSRGRSVPNCNKQMR